MARWWDLSDVEAHALLARTGAGWSVAYFPPDTRRRHREGAAWYSCDLRVNVGRFLEDDPDTLYFSGYGSTFGRATARALIKAVRWAMTGEYRR